MKFLLLQKIESLEASKSNTQYLLSTFYALYVHFTTQSIYIPCLIKCKILSPNSILPELVEEEDCQQSKLGPGKPPTRRLLHNIIRLSDIGDDKHIGNMRPTFSERKLWKWDSDLAVKCQLLLTAAPDDRTLVCYWDVFKVFVDPPLPSMYIRFI